MWLATVTGERMGASCSAVMKGKGRVVANGIMAVWPLQQMAVGGIVTTRKRGVTEICGITVIGSITTIVVMEKWQRALSQQKGTVALREMASWQ
jgi:hypothetical protein